MARPIKNNLDYFPHDNSMRNDRKIKALRSKFEDGYSIYNMLLELLCESDLLIIKFDETEKELVSGDFNVVSERLTHVFEYFSKIGLIKMVNGYIFCPQLDKRAETVFGKRTKCLNDLRIENGINLSETGISDEKTIEMKSETTQSKVNKSKVNKSKEYIPSFEIFKNYALKNKKNVDIEDLKIKYTAWLTNNWNDGNNKPIKNWKSKLLQTLPYIKVSANYGEPKKNKHSDFDDN